MMKCEVIDLTLSDSCCDNDFIQATCHFCNIPHPFLYIKFLLPQVPATMEIILLDLCM